MKRIVIIMLFLVFAVAVFAQDSEQKLSVFEFVKNADWENVALVALFSVGGIITRYAVLARTKLKQVGELLILLHDYTDDKVLDKKERSEIWELLLVIIGKNQAETMKKEIIDDGGGYQVIKQKQKIKIKTRIRK